ncbi:MAG: hypothetical protein ACOCP9_04535 [Halofilum sp. (in: g-proteobacteria)]
MNIDPVSAAVITVFASAGAGSGAIRRAGRGGIALLLTALSAGVPVHAADSAPPSHDPGGVFVLDMADERLGDCIAEPASGYRFTFRCGGGDPRSENLRPYMDPPLRPGKKWTQHFRDVIGGVAMSVHVDVTARERVTVPAGTYDVYRLEIDERRAGAEEGARQTCWYAPEIRFPVKCRGSIGASFELLEYRE